MAGKELVIDDEYCQSMGTFFTEQGKQLDKMLSDYIAALKSTKSHAIKSGELSEALERFIHCAEKLKGCIPNEVSAAAQKGVMNFVTQIDEKDQYLF